ncbi:DUF4169 family protein [Pseudooceanicola nanhaiensis]|uniref:DUF4169 family protein n=1 Tax=Pseudooceanicola nanhaiensis TaxID=375761 RepID=UPI001CD20197|nr:DUF4169 family protein [Pseudooceanicola nanhaiensis]MCA0919870.1 DUF4169 family protein [Pseudooceanicola nanhaiensis]
MAEPVNLNRFRKDKARAEKKARADENAVKFGRSKAQKDAEKARADQARRLLDGHRTDDAPGVDGPAAQDAPKDDGSGA